MSVTLSVRPLNVTAGGARCTVLRIDDTTILLDCGWTSDLREDDLKELTEIAPELDAILISFPDFAHMGALPYLVGRLGITCPIYATVPIKHFSRLFFEELLHARASVGMSSPSSSYVLSFSLFYIILALTYPLLLSPIFCLSISVAGAMCPLFDVNDVDTAIDMITGVQYSREIILNSGEKTSEGLIKLTPHAAGRMMGGTIWEIAKVCICNYVSTCLDAV